MEKIHSVLNAVFNYHAPCVAANEFGSRGLELICQKQRRFFVAQVDNGQLANWSRIARQGDLAIQDSWRPESTGDGLQLNASPGGGWLFSNFIEKLLRSPAKRNKGNFELVEDIQVGVGGELGVEDKFTGKCACSLFPK